MNAKIPPEVRIAAMEAAMGRREFDVLLSGGDVLDVGTCELRTVDVGLVGPLIASVHPRGSRADAGAVHDVSGRIVTPGLIDMHVHFESSMLTPAAYAEAVCPRGTTTVYCDPHELANVAGLAGVRYAVEASRDLPVSFVVQAPSCVPPIPGAERSGAELGAEEIGEMLSWPEIGGLAEVMDSAGVLANTPRMLNVVAAGLESGKPVNGHAAGLRGAALQAYLCAGITSDHEMMADGDVKERLEAGMTVELRGCYEFLLPEVVSYLRRLHHLPTHLVAATDDLFAMTILTEGGIDHLLRRLIGHGLDPHVAIRIATYNAAFRLGRSDLGLVAPGRLADLAVFSDLEAMRVETVFSQGREVARGGRMLEPIHEPPALAPLQTMKLAPLSADDFAFRLGIDVTTAEVRILKGAVFTEWDARRIGTRDGRIELPSDCIFQVVFHRHGRREPTPTVGILSEWGHLRGAIATSFSHDTHNLVVFGREATDMVVAANAVIDAGGGVAVAAGGQVLAEIKLPIAGLLSPLPASEVASRQQEVQRAALDVGLLANVLSQPLFQVMTATLPCIPGPHVTDIGIIDGTTGERFSSLPLVTG